jgi:voltage-gated potassium channel
MPWTPAARRKPLPIPGVDFTRGYYRDPRRLTRSFRRPELPGGAVGRVGLLGRRLGPGLRRSVLLLALVFVLGVAGYMAVERQTLLQAVYTTTVILSTVGLALGDVPHFGAGGQVLTVLLIWGGVGVVAYLLTQVVGFVVTGEFNEVVRARRMEKIIASLHGHVVLCGAEKAGYQALIELSGREPSRTERAGAPHERRTPVVVVCQDEAVLADLRARFEGILAVRGVATEAEVLERANVREARALLACLPTDAENLFLVLTARELAPKLLIVAQASTPDAVDKLRKVGADHVVAPELIAGARMASVALRPTALAFLDVLTRPGEEALRLEEVTIPDGSRWAGSTLADIRIPQRTKLLVMGVSHAEEGGRFVFNPSAQEKLAGGDALIVMGTPDQRGQLERLLAESPPVTDGG